MFGVIVGIYFMVEYCVLTFCYRKFIRQEISVRYLRRELGRGIVTFVRMTIVMLSGVEEKDTDKVGEIFDAYNDWIRRNIIIMAQIVVIPFISAFIIISGYNREGREAAMLLSVLCVKIVWDIIYERINEGRHSLAGEIEQLIIWNDHGQFLWEEKYEELHIEYCIKRLGMALGASGAFSMVLWIIQQKIYELGENYTKCNKIVFIASVISVYIYGTRKIGTVRKRDIVSGINQL